MWLYGTPVFANPVEAQLAAQAGCAPVANHRRVFGLHRSRPRAPALDPKQTIGINFANFASCPISVVAPVAAQGAGRADNEYKFMALAPAFAADAVRQPSAGELAIPVAVTPALEGS